MQTHRSSRYWIFALYIIFTFYCFGAAMINEFVEYYGWNEAGRYMQQENFAAWLTYTSKLRLPLLILPMIITTILSLLLIKHLPKQILRRSLWVVLACHAVAWASTFMFQVPLEMQLSNNGFDAVVMQRLLLTDWLRKGALLIEVVVVLFMVKRVVKAVDMKNIM